VPGAEGVAKLVAGVRESVRLGPAWCRLAAFGPKTEQFQFNISGGELVSLRDFTSAAK
jgi:hypothetical protein